MKGSKTTTLITSHHGSMGKYPMILTGMWHGHSLLSPRQQHAGILKQRSYHQQQADQEDWGRMCDSLMTQKRERVC